MKRNQSLLDKAKEVTTKVYQSENFSKEQVDLVLAWATGEITLKQVQQVMPQGSSAMPYAFLARCLRFHIQSLTKK